MPINMKFAQQFVCFGELKIAFHLRPLARERERVRERGILRKIAIRVEEREAACLA
jgi:hypothetical protein